ncbi:MAG: 6-phosphogluconolactonase, partial [Deltaproteobacteria bacterium]|nr:6-phosphogluconolactonase [Deltaproteobacteria bacterium]
MSEVRRFESIDELSAAAAEELIAIAGDAVRDRGVAHIALSGGSTPKRLFQ